MARNPTGYPWVLWIVSNGGHVVFWVTKTRRGPFGIRLHKRGPVDRNSCEVGPNDRKNTIGRIHCTHSWNGSWT